MGEIYRNGTRFGSDNPIPIVTTAQWASMSSAEKAAYKLVIVDDSIGVDPTLMFPIKSVSLDFNGALTVDVVNENVRETSYCLVFFNDASISAAESAGISASPKNGYITFTAKTAPSSVLVCDVICINFHSA